MAQSGAAQRIHRESEQLGLPTLGSVRDEFDALCRRFDL